MTKDHLAVNAADEMARGRAALQAAEQLFASGLFYDASSRAYHSAFHHARALAWAAGERPRSHKGVAHLLHTHHVATGRLPAETDRLYVNLMTYREKSDHETDFLLDSEGAEQALAAARTLVKRMSALLR